MAESLKMLKVSSESGFRAQLVEMGGASAPEIVDDEPLVDVTFRVPLSDGRRLAAFMYEWVELSASSARLSDGAPRDDEGPNAHVIVVGDPEKALALQFCVSNAVARYTVDSTAAALSMAQTKRGGCVVLVLDSPDPVSFVRDRLSRMNLGYASIFVWDDDGEVPPDLEDELVRLSAVAARAQPQEGQPG